MINQYMCSDCVRRIIGKNLSDCNNDEYMYLVSILSIDVDSDYSGGILCPVCDSSAMVKIFSISEVYVRGYGYTDKLGMKRDMDVHLLTSGNDPYKKYRQEWEVGELINKAKRRRTARPIRKIKMYK